MDLGDLYQAQQSAQQKFFYGLLSVALGSLALSIQFSPAMGMELWWMLLLAWVLFTSKKTQKMDKALKFGTPEEQKAVDAALEERKKNPPKKVVARPHLMGTHVMEHKK
jgi:hypothetical protein